MAYRIGETFKIRLKSGVVLNHKPIRDNFLFKDTLKDFLKDNEMYHYNTGRRMMWINKNDIEDIF